jgi:hypothetical protein
MIRLPTLSASVALVSCALGACASHPAPVDQMAGAEGAARAAQEVGAESSPTAQLHLKLAREALQRAHQAMDQGDNELADFTLLRARADADLALELARESQAESAAKTAADQAASPKSELSTPQAVPPAATAPPPAIPPPSTPAPQSAPMPPNSPKGDRQ